MVLRGGRFRRTPRVAATFKWPQKRVKPGMTPGLRLVQGPEASAGTARQLRWWVRASLFGGDLRGVLRRPFVEPSPRPASTICKAACAGCAAASSVRSKKLVCLPCSLCVNLSLAFSRFLERTVGFWTALGWARAWKLPCISLSSLDESDLSSRPMTFDIAHSAPNSAKEQYPQGEQQVHFP
jgi:hypothetical protein